MLPGRYTWTQSGSYDRFVGSGYDWGITAYNTEAGEVPTVYIWGFNEAGAKTLIVAGKNLHVERTLPDDPYFAVGFYLEGEVAEVLGTLTYRFIDSAGQDVTTQFEAPDS